ncbi:MAG: hypothetical protein ACJAX5_002538 [Patiriisocius sp.]
MSLNISLGTSRFQLSVIFLIAGVGMLSLWMSAIPQAMQIAVSFVVLLSAWDSIRRSVVVDPDSIQRLQFEAGSWWITLADGRIRKVLQVDEQVVLPWIVSLGFSDGRQRFDCAILWDALTPTEHRKLRAVVLMNETPASDLWLTNLWLAIAGWYQNCVDRLRGH